MSRTTFVKMWNMYCPKIMVMKPMSDLCWLCQKNSMALIRSVNTPEEEKSQVNIPAVSHN